MKNTKTDKERARNLRAYKRGDWMEAAGFERLPDGTFKRSPEMDAMHQRNAALLGDEAADAIETEAAAAGFKAWMRWKFPHPWEDRPEIQRHYQDTKQRDTRRELVPFWRRWARFWFEATQPEGATLPGFAEPQTQNGRGRNWPSPPEDLPSDDPAHEIGAHEKLKGLFLTGNFAQQEVAAALTQVATGAVPVWLVPVPGGKRQQRRRSGGKTNAQRQAAYRKRKRERGACASGNNQQGDSV
jgi:hypothetical protein